MAMVTAADVGSDYRLDREVIGSHARVSTSVNLQREHRTEGPAPDAVERKYRRPDRERALGRGLAQQSMQPAQRAADG